MNLTFSMPVSLEADEDRPPETEEALQSEVRVGWRDGSPVVGDTTVRLGEDPSEAYELYYRRDDLLLPQAGSFVRSLFAADEITSVDDAAQEVKSDTRTVERAAELHGVDLDDLGGDTDGESDGEGHLPMPNGERIPLDSVRSPLHEDARVLHCLLGRWGMSTDEASHYVSANTESDPSERDIREAASECGLG